MTSSPLCCCWVLDRSWLGWPLVYRCLLGKADTKPQRRRLTTQQQHMQWPVTTPGSSSATSPRLQSITPRLMLPRATTPKRLRTIPRPLITTPARHRSTTLQHTLLQLNTPRFPSTTPPRHRNTTQLDIMGKYSVTCSYKYAICWILKLFNSRLVL